MTLCQTLSFKLFVFAALASNCCGGVGWGCDAPPFLETREFFFFFAGHLIKKNILMCVKALRERTKGENFGGGWRSKSASWPRRSREL